MIDNEELEQRVRAASDATYLLIPEEVDIILVADNHSNRSIRHHLQRNLPVLVQMGVTNYGAEAKTSEKSEYGKITQSRGQYTAPSNVDFGPGRDDFRNLVYAAARLGMEVYPFDPRQVTPEKYDDRDGSFSAKAERDTAHNIEQQIKQHGKGVLLVGGFHTQRGSGGFIDTLESDGYKCITIGYFGGETIGKHLVERAAQVVGRQDDAFVLDNREKDIPPGYDLMIHLPETIKSDPFSGLLGLDRARTFFIDSTPYGGF